MLAGRLGQGLQRVYQLDEQRETAVALQHAMLGPATLPGGFAVRYHPASRPLQVGGDWYDVVDLDDGRVALIVGDCVGHGLAAATVMGQLRSACRALLLEQSSPERRSRGTGPLRRASARRPLHHRVLRGAHARDRRTGVLQRRSSAADHGACRRHHRACSTAARASRWRCGRTWIRPEAHVTMPARATLLLYTDGLVERRGDSIDDGMARAADLVQDGRSRARRGRRSTDVRLEPTGGYPDDVAMLLYRQPAPLEMDFTADVGHLAPSRAALRSWLSQAGVEPDQIQDVLIATGEAVANAIEHGHRDRPEGIVSLRATAVVDRLHVTVIDTGVWKTPRQVPSEHRGRGISLMRGLMEDFTIHSSDAGTTVHMYARIT